MWVLSPKSMGTQRETQKGKRSTSTSFFWFLICLGMGEPLPQPSAVSATVPSPPWWMESLQAQTQTIPFFPYVDSAGCWEQQTHPARPHFFPFDILLFHLKCTFSKEYIFGWISLNKVVMSGRPCLLTHLLFVLCFPLPVFGLWAVFLTILFFL